MHEATLRAFFEGNCSVAVLRQDLSGSVNTEGKVSRYLIVDMDAEFEVRSHHLANLCEALLAGELDPNSLETIGFCLCASDCFFWDSGEPNGALVSEAVFQWAAPQINLALNQENTRLFRDRLQQGPDTV